MKNFLLLTFCLLFISSCNNVSNKKQISTQEIILKLDKAFFKGNCPKDITLAYEDIKTAGGFDPNKNIIKLNPKKYSMNNENMVVTHEACHLCLANLTNKNSNKEEFRFIDEGWASIVGGDFSSQYKINSIIKTKEKINTGEVSFKKVQKWKIYFGGSNTGKYNWSAYNVGTSFVYFILDTYSQDKLYDFFISIGKTENLSASILETFNKQESEFEKDWLGYVKSFDFENEGTVSKNYNL
jgi:predicted SprT family Zn-dependent metalloprotease